jgi:glutamate dehydrogenase/leucine dehydrogenase
VLRAYARYVDALGGRYITAEDVGTTQADMDLIHRETRHVTGVSPSLGGSGDPSVATAFGVLQAMKAAARHLWGSSVLQGRHVVISGVGKVGSYLGRHLVEEGARLSVSDVDPVALSNAVETLGAEVVPVEKAHATDCDIFSPCAMGGALDPTTIEELHCQLVVGGANNQLADPSCARLLQEVGVLYVPDYVANAGGLINVAEEILGYDEERAYAKVRGIHDTTAAVLEAASAQSILPSQAADRLAEGRLEQLGHVRLIRTGRSPERG